MASKIALVEGAGFLSTLITELRKAVHAEGGSDLDIHALATTGGHDLVEDVARLIVESRKRQVHDAITLSDPMQVSIDRRDPLAKAIEEGRFDWHNRLYDDLGWESFSGHEPIQALEAVERHMEVRLFRLSEYFGDDYEPEGEEILDALERLKLDPKGLAELLEFGKKFPAFQREFPIAAFGSVWKDPQDERRKVPVLWGSEKERRLGLPWLDGIWVPEACILVTPK